MVHPGEPGPGIEFAFSKHGPLAGEAALALTCGSGSATSDHTGCSSLGSDQGPPLSHPLIFEQVVGDGQDRDPSASGDGNEQC